MWLWIPRDDDVADSANIERDGVRSEGGGAEGGVEGLGRRALWARPAEAVLEVRGGGVAGWSGGVGDGVRAAAQHIASLCADSVRGSRSVRQPCEYTDDLVRGEAVRADVVNTSITDFY